MSIAVQWVVFAELSTDAMIATGITDKPSAARWIVETIMADVGNAGWGEVLRVPVPGEAPTDTELTAWPPPGEVWVCRRTGQDGFKWMPLFCAELDTVKQRQPWDLREAPAASSAGSVIFPGQTGTGG
jgi:hypothetical protein